MISYNADSGNLYGCLYHTPAGTWPQGTMMKIYDWDSTVYLGEIAQAPVTYNVIGNMNEYQLAITETTFGGLEQLSHQSAAKIDYGSLIYVTLSRAKTARDAVRVMGELTATYGYYSEGESFSITDTKEVWILEMIGKGNDTLGAVWVAVRIPDGYVSGHANQARIRTFPLNDPDNAIYAPDVITFARSKGLYNGTDAEFSFSDVYDPVTFEGARFCEARVWAMFNQVTSGMDQYLDYAQGFNLSNRMPLYVKPDKKKVALTDIQGFMGNHFEGTWFDFSKDVGAGPYALPYRWRPLTWKVTGDSHTYVNERAAGTQQTAFTMVAQTRDWLPINLGGLLWFSPDEGSSAVYAPMYSSMNKVPDAYICDWQGSGPNGNITHYDPNKAFWVFSLVANWRYTRYSDMQPEIGTKQKYYQNKFASEVAETDKQAANLTGNALINHLTTYSNNAATSLIRDWQAFFGYLFARYSDGYIKTTQSGSFLPQVDSPGYGNPWYNRIVTETGDHYEEPYQYASTPAGRRKLQVRKLL